MVCLQLPFIREEEAVSWTQRFLTRKIWPKSQSLFMTNKFDSNCLHKIRRFKELRQEKECYRKTTSYLEQPSRHFCQYFMRITTQQTFLATNLASQQKTTKHYFSSQVRRQFKILIVACIEDITWPRGDTKFLFECSKIFLKYFFQHEKRNFVSPSDHVMFYLLYKNQWNTNHFI